MIATTVDTLNSLLRGEIAATETYIQALEKWGTESGAVELARIRDEHRDAANALRQHVRSFGGDPDQGSGAWGAFAKAVEGTAKLFGNTAALKALKEGEEHGRNAYLEALQDPDLSFASKSLIDQLLPRTTDHIAMLDGLMRRQ